MINCFRSVLTWNVCLVHLVLLKTILPFKQVEREKPFDALLNKLVHTPIACSISLKTCLAHWALRPVVLERNNQKPIIKLKSESENYFLQFARIEGLLTKFLSMQLLQKVCPHNVVTGCKSKRRQSGQLKSPSYDF